MPKPNQVAIDVEPIDRLEEKVKALVAVVGRLRTEQARTTEENQRLTRELEATRARLAEIEGVSAEVTMLKEERAVVRSRVAEMLEQIEALSL